MTPRNKKILYGGLIVILIILLVLFFTRQPDTSGEGGGFFSGLFPGGGKPIPPDTYPPTATSTNPGGGPIDWQDGGHFAVPNWILTPLGSDPVASLYVGTSSVGYHKKTPENLGYLFSRDRSNLVIEKLVLNYLVQGIARVSWAPDGKKALIWYRDDDGSESVMRKFFIDYSSSTPRTRVLADDIGDVVFSPDSLSVAYTKRESGTNNIFTMDVGFKKSKDVFTNTIPNVELFWPEKNTLAFKTKSSFAIKSFLYTINLKTGALTKVAEGLGIDVLWNKDAYWMVYSSTDKNGSLLPLKLVNTGTKTVVDLPFKTLAEKCVFGKFDFEQLYCGVPDNRQNKYPDAWWQGLFKNEDSLFIINVALNPQKILAAKSLYLDIQNLGTLWDDTRIFFVDRTTHLPWTIKFADAPLPSEPTATSSSSTTPSR
jgi:hypothetical protein